MPKIFGIPLDALFVVLPPESGLFDVMRQSHVSRQCRV
jgi:hypothetical protein